MWQSIRSAAEAMLNNDLTLANAILEVKYGAFVICFPHLNFLLRRVISQPLTDRWR